MRNQPLTLLRDKPSLSVILRLLSATLKRVFLKRSDPNRDLQHIIVSDCLRILNIQKIARKRLEYFQPKSEALTFWKNLVIATSYQYQGLYEQSNKTFQKIEQTPDAYLRSFALQHFGKSLAEQRRFSEGLKKVEEALMLRQQFNKPDLVYSSESALAAIKEFLNQSDFRD